MRFELFFKTGAELRLLLRNTRSLDITVNKFNLPNKIKHERKDLLKSASIIQNEYGKSGETIDVCIHYSMKNNKGKTVEESLAMFTSFVDQVSSLSFSSESSSENPVREILLCSGGGKEKTKPDSVEILKSLSTAVIPSNISLAVVFNPYEINTENEQRRLKEKLFYNVNRIYLQFGSDLNKLIEGMDFIVELNKERLLRGDVPLNVAGSVMLPSKQLLARFRFRPWAGLVLSGEFLNNIDFADKTVRNIIRIYRKYNVEPIIETAVTNKNLEYFKDLFCEFECIKDSLLAATNKRERERDTTEEDCDELSSLKRARGNV